MSGAERRMHKGRPVITRAALMRAATVDRSVAEAWYGNRAHNGHPRPVLASGRSLYFDEADLLSWVHLQLDPTAAAPRIVHGGRNLVTRAELARLTGLSEAALRHIYANRAVTGHPEVVHRDRRALYFDEHASLTWHLARRRRGPPVSPPVDGVRLAVQPGTDDPERHQDEATENQ